MTQKLAEFANKDTPAEIYVPATWPALITWAVGKFGIGVIFAAMLIPVYLDLRTSNQAMVDVARSSAEAIGQLASKIEAQNQKIDRLAHDVRYSGKTPSPKPFQE
jgi:hypothetical protein